MALLVGAVLMRLSYSVSVATLGFLIIVRVVLILTRTHPRGWPRSASHAGRGLSPAVPTLCVTVLLLALTVCKPLKATAITWSPTVDNGTVSVAVPVVGPPVSKDGVEELASARRTRLPGRR